MNKTIEFTPAENQILANYCASTGMSESEAVREAVMNLPKVQEDLAARKARILASAGIFAGMNIWGDSLEYQRKIRAEWDDH